MKLDKKDIEDILALTPLQEGMLFHYLKEPESGLYVIQLCLDLSGSIEPHQLEAAWNQVAADNELLRTVFRWEKLSSPVQIVLKKQAVDFRYIDISDQQGDAEQRLREIRKQDVAQGFDLIRVPFRITLVRLQENKCMMMISNHHILYDGWSNGVLLKEFFRALEPQASPVNGGIAPKSRFKDFIAILRGLDKDASHRYWANYLNGLDTVTPLPFVKQTPQANGIYTYREHFFAFDADTTHNIQAYLASHRSSLAAFIYTAWGILLQKCVNTDEVMFGITVSGRRHKLTGIEHAIGMYINTIPFRFSGDAQQNLTELIKSITQQIVDVGDYENTGLLEIKAASAFGDSQQLFSSLVTIQNYPLEGVFDHLKTLTIDSFSSAERTNYDFTLNAITGRELGIKLRYNGLLFEHADILRLSRYFSDIITAIAGGLVQHIQELDILRADEKQQLIYGYNNTRTEYPKDAGLLNLFQEQVKRHPAKAAAIFRGKTMSYEQLDRMSDSLAAELQKTQHIASGDRIGVLTGYNPDALVAFMAILKVGGCYVPIDPDLPADRIDYILSDTKPGMLIIHSEHLEKVILHDIPLFNLDIELNEDAAMPFEHVGREPGQAAYIMYTSGSSGQPKGVVVADAGIIRLVKNANYIEITSSDTILGVSSYAFDGSTFDIWGSLLNGATLVISGKDPVMDLDLFSTTVHEHNVSVLFITTALFNTLVDNNLESFNPIRKVLFGGEQVSVKHVLAFFRRYGSNKLIHVYGPTENTTFSTYYPVNHVDDANLSLPIGYPISNTSCYVLDRHLNVLPSGVPGELFVAGDGLAGGYFNQPELTRLSFLDNPFEPGTNMYRTGDWVKRLEDGAIEFVGRKDSQVKIRGFRIELREIEHHLAQHAGVNACLVLARTSEGMERELVAYLVAEQNLDVKQVKQFLAGRLPAYMIPAHVIRIDQFPLTKNGKINKAALPAPGLHTEKKTEVALSATEQTMQAVWAGILNLEKDKIGMQDSFFDLGGHSLKVTTLSSHIFKTFDVKIPLSQIFKYPTIRDLAAYVDSLDAGGYKAIPRASQKPFYKLSPSQKRLFILQQFDKESVKYHVTGIISISKAYGKPNIEAAFQELIRRHESLRTSFEMMNGEPVQKINNIAHLSLSTLSEKPLPILKNEFVRPFNLSQAPLCRVAYVETGGQDDLLLVDMHHIVTDGMSHDILERELYRLCEGGQLPPLTLQYKDYSEWMNSDAERHRIQNQGQYWKELFSGDIPVLTLPYDFARPQLMGLEGQRASFTLAPEDVSFLRDICKEEDVTLYMLILALLNVLLSKLSGQEDLVIGSPVAARRHADLEQVVGMFVNTLAMRNYPGGEKDFSSFLQEVKRQTLLAYENQEYAFEDLVNDVSTARDMSRNPLFDVMFVLQNQSVGKERPDLQRTADHVSHPAKFDLMVDAVETDDTILFSFDYSTALFKPESINRFIGYFINSIRSLRPGLSIKLKDLDIIGREEYLKLVNGFNDTACPYPKDQTVCELFDSQAARTPDNPALVCGDLQLSYREVQERSAHLAGYLRKKGVRPEEIVGLHLERSPELIIGILGILKAGGAYMPIDPEYPSDRKQYMLSDSACKLVISDRDFSVPEGVGILKLSEQYIPQEQAPLPTGPVCSPSNLAYVIYTSGSTGQPKGVMIEHGSLVNRLHWMQKHYRTGAGDVILQKTPYTFDVSVWELLLWSITGSTLVLLAPGGEKDPEEILKTVEKQKVSMMHFVPSMLKVFLQYVEKTGRSQHLKSLKWLICSGEALGVHEARTCNELLGKHGTVLSNLYGPTEATIDVSYYDCPPELDADLIPIGKPIDNIRLFVLNQYGGIQGTGIAGELHISGDGLARGYLNKETLTQEKFVANPYQQGTRLYKTGDLARWLPDGNIEYLGRIDDQLKVRGYRIEPGEIENCLLSYNGIREAIVAVKGNSTEKALVGYYVTDAEIDEQQLRSFLLSKLPAHMVPPHLMSIERIPLTANGKADRKRLPEPLKSRNRGPAAPRTQIESRLLDIWKEVLSNAEVGIDDNFFDAGGNSLNSITLITRINEEFTRDESIVSVFKYPTIQVFAQYLESAKTGAPADKPASISQAAKISKLINNRKVK